MRKIKTIRTYTGLASFIATLKEKPSGALYVAGYMPMHMLPAKPKFSFSAAWPFYRINKDGMPCVTYIETAHRVYEVWEAETESDFENLVSEEKAQSRYNAA
jgi:hypothetical protein